MRPLEEHRRLYSTSSVIIVSSSRIAIVVAVVVVVAEYEWFDDVLDYTRNQWVTLQPRLDALMCGVFRRLSFCRFVIINIVNSSSSSSIVIILTVLCRLSGRCLMVVFSLSS